MNANVTLCVDLVFQPINNVECIISRITGSILILVSCFSILFSIRFLYWSVYHRQNRSHHNLLILSMIFSSLLVMSIIIPSVILQYLTCRRLCSLIFCQIEGFISYLNGCEHMFMLMMISIIRYDAILHTSLTKQYFKQHSYLSVAICWLFAFIFAVPPLFNWNKYIPEGVGLHCGLNWTDHSLSSRVYLILAFLFVYFIPLLVLSIVNIYVYCVIRRLLYANKPTNNHQSLIIVSLGEGLSGGKSRLMSLTSSHITAHSVRMDLRKFLKFIPIDNHLVCSPTTDRILTYHRMHLKRLKADRRFALATMFLVVEYLLSWTPYACIALLYLFHMKCVIEQPLLLTVSAFIAKVSMIINPFIYAATMKTNYLTTILFCKRCSCPKCRINKPLT